MAPQRPLAPRLQRTVDLALQGYSNKEIGYRMGITAGTVKVYLSVSRCGSRYALMGSRIRELEQRVRDLQGTPAGAD